MVGCGGTHAYEPSTQAKTVRFKAGRTAGSRGQPEPHGVRCLPGYTTKPPLGGKGSLAMGIQHEFGILTATVLGQTTPSLHVLVKY